MGVILIFFDEATKGLHNLFDIMGFSISSEISAYSAMLPSYIFLTFTSPSLSMLLFVYSPNIECLPPEICLMQEEFYAHISLTFQF